MSSTLRNSPFLRSVLVLVSGTTMAQLLPILVMPLVSRMFSPNDFGVLGLFTAFVAVASVGVCLSFQLAIVSDVSDREAAQVAVLAFVPILPLSALSVGILWLLRANDMLGFHELNVTDLLWAFVAIVAIGMFGVSRYWMVREEQFGSVSRATVWQSVGRVAGQLSGGTLGFGSGGLLVAEAVGRIFGVSTLARSSLGRIRLLVSDTSYRSYWELVTEYRKFPLLNMPSALLNTVGTALLVPLIASSYGLTVAGQFSMGYRVLTLPLAVVASAVADVFHVQLVKAVRMGMIHARRLFLKVTAGLMLVGLLPSIAMVMWGPELFSFVLGDQWAQAGGIASGLMPWLLCSFAVSPVSRVVMVFRGQEMKLIYDILNLAGVVGVVQAGSHFQWPLEQTARTLGATQAFAYFVYFVLLWHIVAKQKDKNGIASHEET